MMVGAWLRMLGRFVREQGGNTAIVFAFCLLPLVGAAGLALDSLLAFTVEERLQKALDAAGLAAGRANDPANIQADARAFFDTNFEAGPDLASVTSFSVRVTETDEGQSIALAASATMPTRIMRIFGKDQVTVSANAVINRAIQGVELVMVLDTTYSMLIYDNRIGGLKVAAKELLNILFGDNETKKNLYVGIVPYIASVNVGTANINFLAATDPVRSGGTNPYAPETWGGCVLARAAPRDQNDDPPSVAPFTSYLYPNTEPGNPWPNTWPPNDRRERVYSSGHIFREFDSPNAGCPTPIVPLGARKSQLVAAIDGLRPEPRGGTIVSEGLAWGWRAISPRWRGLWSGSPTNLPLAYNTPRMIKVIIVLTDGENQMLVDNNRSPYNAYVDWRGLGVSASEISTFNELNRRTKNVCNNVKAAGIKIYSIMLGNAGTTARNLMRDCASEPSMYFYSPDNATLRTAFKKIGSELANLRIAQ